MLSIAKLRVGSEAYQLSGVAQSLDDYYTGVGEAAGRWLGAGAERLGLSGEVAPDDLRAVLAGLAPGSGGLTPDGATVRTHARRVPGFDVTLKAPKSVSVLYAVSDDPRVQGAIIEAGEAAVRETLSWLERESIQVRRGSGDVAYLNDLAARDPEAADAARQRMLPGRGVVAASFRHRTSRSGDPLLHWHTLVANMVEGPDGRWGAFVHPELYRAARAAGEVFQTVLRGELTERLGLEWRPGRHVLEVAGVPQALCDQFSKRSVEIDAWLAATGTPDDPAGRQQAVLATRRGKPEVEGERFDAQWKAEATAARWGPDAAEALIASTSERRVPGVGEVWRIPVHDDRTGVVTDRTVDPEEWIAELGRAVTEHDSTFTRPELVQAVAARIGEGATAATLDRMVARVLASEQVVPISDGPTGRWTTVELMGVERRFLDTAETTRGTRRPVADAEVDRALAAFVSLGADQEQAVRTLTATSDAVSVMVGPAGTGKTYTLDAVRQVFQTARYDVVGVAPSARAAHELHADAHIESSTIHRMLGSWSRGYDLPHARTVLVVDEAGMAAIRDLEQVVPRVISAGGRVLLVGDHHQLPEVAAGGGFAALATDPAAAVAELIVNRRQHNAWEREALAELRDGHVADAVAAYRDHDRVVVVADRAATVHAGVERWLDAHRDGHIPVLLAGTNETVGALNAAVRRQLLDLGVLGPAVEGSGGSLAIGERLMIRVNDYQASTTTGERTAVLNGQTGTLTGVCDAGLVARMDHGHTDVILTHDHLAHGGVGYAYASTAHKAQGGTWDLAITVGVDGLYREAGYLVMSRGRASNWLIVTAPEIDALDTELGRHDSPIPLPGEEPDSVDEELVGRLNVSRRKLLAVTRDSHAEAIQHAATHLELTTLEGWAAHARAVEEQASRIVGCDPDRTRDRLARTDHTARHAAVGQRVKAWDRRNIGTITALDDHNGAVAVTFNATDGRTTTKTMRWGDVSIVQPRQPAAPTLSPAAADVLDRLMTAARQSLARWDAHLAEHGVQPGDRHVYERAAHLAIDRAGAGLAAAQPDWLTALLGQRPTDRPAAVQVWDDTVHDLAAHRVRHGITDPAIATGPDTDAIGRIVWDAVSPTMAAARVWLDTYTTSLALPPVRTRSLAELHARRAELHAVFADAPADHRQLIDRLRDGGMLPLEDTAELLGDALAAQGERRRWILEHWPHVVEYAEITHTLRNGLAGPDVAPLVDTFADSTHRHLAAAANEGESWLVTLTAHLVPADVATIDAAAEQLLADVAGYRHRWAVTGPLPLGDAATDIDQANERDLLAIAIDHTVAEFSIEVDDPWGMGGPDQTDVSRLPALDDTLGW